MKGGKYVIEEKKIWYDWACSNCGESSAGVGYCIYCDHPMSNWEEHKPQHDILDKYYTHEKQKQDQHEEDERIHDFIRLMNKPGAMEIIDSTPVKKFGDLKTKKDFDEWDETLGVRLNRLRNL